MHLKESFKFAALLFVCACFASCGNTAESRRAGSIPTDIGLSDAKIEVVDPKLFDAEIIEHFSDGGSAYLVDFIKFKKGKKEPLGRFIALSKDNGKSFSSEIGLDSIYSHKSPNILLNAAFIGDRIAISILESGSLSFSLSQTGLQGWSEPAKINDSPRSASFFGGFAAFDESRFTVVWQDNRSGDLEIFSSMSTDGGKTWSLNLPVDGEFSGDSQESASLAIGENERLILAWSDWRSKETLVDIRYATSDDKGLTWSKSRVLNDDNLEVWQFKPQVLAEGQNVVIAFADFRENGEDDDRDWKIYFAQSHDNGETWSKNRRLNRVATGRQSEVKCAKTEPGGFYCTDSSTDKSIFGQIMAVASADFGSTWSQEVPLNSIEGFDIFARHTTVAFSNGRIIVRSPVLNMNSVRNPIIVAEPGFPNLLEREDPNQQISPIAYEAGGTLFFDDFTGVEANQWEVSEGKWRIENGAYKGDFGFRSQNHHSGTYKTFARFQEPDRYELTGKFLLILCIRTKTASIYLRVSDQKHLVVTNQFRRGAWLAYEEDVNRKAENVLEIGSWSEKPLIGKRISFKNNVWYLFRIVVTPEQIDYYVNGKHLFSSRQYSRIRQWQDWSRRTRT